MPSAAAEKANKCIGGQGVVRLLYIAATILLLLNIIFTFISPDEKLNFFSFVVLVYIAFFVLVLIFTQVVKVPFARNTFAFMKHRFGPSLFIIFIGKPCRPLWFLDSFDSGFQHRGKVLRAKELHELYRARARDPAVPGLHRPESQRRGPRIGAEVVFQRQEVQGRGD